MAHPVVEERHYHRASDDTSVMSTVLALLAVLLIVGFALYMFRVFPFAGTVAPGDAGTRTNIQLNTPDLTPDNNVNITPSETTPANP